MPPSWLFAMEPLGKIYAPAYKLFMNIMPLYFTLLGGRVLRRVLATAACCMCAFLLFVSIATHTNAAENWDPGQPPQSVEGNVEMPGAGAQVVENGEFGSCESEGVMSYDVTTDRLVVCSSSGVWMTIPGANCMAGYAQSDIYAISYPHSTLAHGATTSLFATASIAGGTASYTAQGLCDDGAMKVSGETEAISCSSGYTLQGGSCMAMCNSSVVEGYSHGDMTHGETEEVSKVASISGGSATYTATASCSSGVVSISDESVSSVSCNSGYQRSGNSCMALKRSCLDLLQSGYRSSGVYTIDPDGSGGGSSFKVYCDQQTNGGGWTALTNPVSMGKGSKFPSLVIKYTSSSNCWGN